MLRGPGLSVWFMGAKTDPKSVYCIDKRYPVTLAPKITLQATDFAFDCFLLTNIAENIHFVIIFSCLLERNCKIFSYFVFQNFGRIQVFQNFNFYRYRRISIVNRLEFHFQKHLLNFF